jgi:hypothetical protein
MSLPNAKCSETERDENCVQTNGSAASPKKLRQCTDVLKSAGGVNNDELQYLSQVERIMETGSARGDRTGTGTLSVFGMQSRYSLAGDIMPLLTTKVPLALSARAHCFSVFSGELSSRSCCGLYAVRPMRTCYRRVACTFGMQTRRASFSMRVDCKNANKAILVQCTDFSGVTLVLNIVQCVTIMVDCDVHVRVTFGRVQVHKASTNCATAFN